MKHEKQMNKKKMCVCENECVRFFLGNTKTNNNNNEMSVVWGKGNNFVWEIFGLWRIFGLWKIVELKFWGWVFLFLVLEIVLCHSNKF